MKKYNLIFLFILMAFCGAFAQEMAMNSVREVNRGMSLGNNTALLVEFPLTSEKVVKEAWGNYVKKYYNSEAKWQKKQKEWFTDNVNIPAIGGATPVDLHAKTEKTGENTTFSLWVNMGTAFLNSRDNYDQYREAEKMVQQFTAEVNKENTKMDLAGQEKTLKEMEKELERLETANKRYNSDIEKAKETIRKSEEGIATNVREQEIARQKIESQKQVVGNVKQKLGGM